MDFEICLNFEKELRTMENKIDIMEDTDSFRDDSISKIAIKKTKVNEEIKNKSVGNKKKCRICLGDTDNTIYLNCLHYYCYDCLYEYLIQKIGDIYLIDNITCPECKHVFSYKNVVSIISQYPNFKEKCLTYLMNLRNNRLLKLDKNIYFTCPVIDCDSYIYIKSIDLNSKFIKCKDNNHNICILCKRTLACHYGGENCWFPSLNHTDKEKYYQCDYCGYLNLKSKVLKYSSYRCPSCAIEKCLLCNKILIKMSRHFKVISPCMYLTGLKADRILYRSKLARYIRMILIIVYYVLAILGSMLLAGMLYLNYSFFLRSVNLFIDNMNNNVRIKFFGNRNLNKNLAKFNTLIIGCCLSIVYYFYVTLVLFLANTYYFLKLMPKIIKDHIKEYSTVSLNYKNYLKEKERQYNETMVNKKKDEMIDNIDKLIHRIKSDQLIR